jgi:hypothetical protein
VAPLAGSSHADPPFPNPPATPRLPRAGMASMIGAGIVGNLHAFQDHGRSQATRATYGAGASLRDRLHQLLGCARDRGDRVRVFRGGDGFPAAVGSGAASRHSRAAPLGPARLAQLARLARPRPSLAEFEGQPSLTMEGGANAFSGWRVFGGASGRHSEESNIFQRIMRHYGGGGRIRTCVGLPRRIYSPLHLTALPPLRDAERPFDGPF